MINKSESNRKYNNNNRKNDNKNKEKKQDENDNEKKNENQLYIMSEKSQKDSNIHFKSRVEKQLLHPFKSEISEVKLIEVDLTGNNSRQISQKPMLDNKESKKNLGNIKNNKNIRNYPNTQNIQNIHNFQNFQNFQNIQNSKLSEFKKLFICIFNLHSSFKKRMLDLNQISFLISELENNTTYDQIYFHNQINKLDEHENERISYEGLYTFNIQNPLISEVDTRQSNN